MSLDTPYKTVRSLDMTIKVGQFVVDDAQAPLALEGEKGLFALLDQLASLFPNRERDAQGSTIRVFDDRHAVAAKEPGLLTFAFGPVKDVGEIRIELETFQRALFHPLQTSGARSLVMGYLPSPDDASPLHSETLLTIERLDAALPEQATMIGEAAAPLLALLCDNSPEAPESSNIAHARLAHDEGRSVEQNGNRLALHVADALPAPFATAFATLVKGLFATDEALELAWKTLGEPNRDDVERAWDRIGADGFDAMVYGKPAHELADALIECACTTLATNEHNYLVPFRHLIRTRKTLTMMGRKQR